MYMDTHLTSSACSWEARSSALLSTSWTPDCAFESSADTVSRTVCCSVLQCVAVCCSVLQCVILCLIIHDRRRLRIQHWHRLTNCVLQCVTVSELCVELCFSVFALCCTVLQRLILCFITALSRAVCCIVLQCVALCCSVLQCVAVCCSVLQCVAVCCTVL